MLNPKRRSGRMQRNPRNGYSLMMLGVCALFLLLGIFYQDHSRGFDGMRALGAVWGGFAGIIISLVMLLISVFGRML